MKVNTKIVLIASLFFVSTVYIGSVRSGIFKKVKGGFEDLGDKIKDTGKRGVESIKTAAEKTKEAFDKGVKFGGKVFRKSRDLIEEAARRFVSCAKVVGPGTEYGAKKAGIETAKVGLEVARQSLDIAKFAVEMAKNEVQVAQEAQRAALKATEAVGKAALETGKFAVTVGGKAIELSGSFIDSLLEHGIIAERIFFKTQLNKLHRSEFEFEGRVAGKPVKVGIYLDDLSRTLFALLTNAGKIRESFQVVRKAGQDVGREVENIFK